ncbi:MAG: hypothetical protein HUK00_02750 [Bacteroidaceae bacterium]|nr:hypothetical protein [Bacteroidaceae bacterium]
MNYKRIRCGGALCELSALGCGAPEWHAMIHVDDAAMGLREQVMALEEGVRGLLDGECRGARAVFARVFLSDAANQRGVVDEALDLGDCALSVVEQPPLDGTKAALWVWLMTGVEISRSGSGLLEVRQGAYRHLFCARQHREGVDSYGQTVRLLEDYAGRLRQEGLSLEADCVRTWFFVHGIDSNYAGMVRGRNHVFAREGLTEQTHFIASTGIGGRHDDAGVSVLMDAYAVGGLKEGQMRYLYAPTHLNRTAEYGVSFERGVCVDYAERGFRQVMISGTASIDNRGAVVHMGDIRRQTERMAENVEALLKEGGCGWGDVQMMIVYLRDISDRDVVMKWFGERFGNVPRVFVYGRVCRPGWLIEMECMAVCGL